MAAPALRVRIGVDARGGEAVSARLAEVAVRSAGADQQLHHADAVSAQHRGHHARGRGVLVGVAVEREGEIEAGETAMQAVPMKLLRSAPSSINAFGGPIHSTCARLALLRGARTLASAVVNWQACAKAANNVHRQVLGFVLGRGPLEMPLDAVQFGVVQVLPVTPQDGETPVELAS